MHDIAYSDYSGFTGRFAPEYAVIPDRVRDKLMIF